MRKLAICSLQGNGFSFPFVVRLFLFKNALVLITIRTCRTSVSKQRWEKLEGTFSLSTLPDRVVFYMEGPSPGVDLLVESVVISCPSRSELNVSLMSNPL